MTSGYLILIVALCGVAGLLLYARFASRSRENSLPEEAWTPPVGQAIGIREALEVPSTVVAESEPVVEPPVEESVPVAVEAKRDGDSARSGGRDGESEYLDDLQEAAAGLAMLMRSSPVAERTKPVVFEPAAEDCVVDDAAARADEEVVAEETMSELVEKAPPVATVDERLSAEDDSLPSTRTLAEILGAEVTERFAVIDHGLDELEELVAGIESSFAGLGLEGESVDVELFEAAA